MSAARRRYESCALCGQELLDLSASRVAKQITGWQLPRKGGGVHAVSMREETGALAHVACVKAGKYDTQAQLWSE